jgi:hypothetical protein
MTQVVLQRKPVARFQQPLSRGLVFVDCAVCGSPVEITQLRARNQRPLCDEHRLPRQ